MILKAHTSREINRYLALILLLVFITLGCKKSVKPIQIEGIDDCKNKECIGYGVPGKIFPIKQQFRFSCWASVMTMLYSWKEQKPLKTSEVVSQFGDKYKKLYKNSNIQGINITDEIELYEIAGLEIERQLNPTFKGWEEKLRDFGPLSITVDADPPYGGTIHSLLIVGIGESGDSINMNYIDPGDGKLHIVNFLTFLQQYEAKGAVNWPIQIIHFPK